MTRLLVIDPGGESRLNFAESISRVIPEATIGSADGTAQALELVAGDRYDCILAAATHLEHSGLDLFRDLRRRADDTPFVLLFDRLEEAGVREALAAGVDNCYSRPNDETGFLALAANIRRLAADRQHIDRLKSDNAIQQKDALHYRRIVETTSQGVWLIDGRGVTTYVNQRLADMLGYTVDEMVGRSVFRFMDDEWRAKALERYKEDGPDKIQNLEFKYIRKDGTELWAYLTANPILSEKGRLKAGLAMITDITEKLAAEKAVRESEARFRQLAESVEDVFFLRTRDRMLYVSPSYEIIFGRCSDSLYENPDFYLDAIHPDDRDRVLEAIRAEREEGRGFKEEFRIVRPDGEVRWIKARSYPVVTNNQEQRISGVIEDITDRVMREEELRRSREKLEQQARLLTATNQELEAFAYTVSHDLQAPLRRISGWIKLIMRDLSQSAGEELLNYIMLVDNNSREMRRLVDVLLDFSRMMRKELAREDVDLGRIAHAIAAELRQEHPHRKAEFRIAEGLRCSGDALLLRVAMANLISNAWKYTSREEKAEIEIGSFERDGSTVFFVRDNGVGFNPAHAELIFVPFQRMHTDEDFQGLGIGLATVQRIIHRHGGRIWAEGRPGDGAAFYFTLG